MRKRSARLFFDGHTVAYLRYRRYYLQRLNLHRQRNIDRSMAVCLAMRDKQNLGCNIQAGQLPMPVIGHKNTISCAAVKI